MKKIISKEILKKWWFWLVTAVVLISIIAGIILVVNLSKNNTDSNNNTKKKKPYDKSKYSSLNSNSGNSYNQYDYSDYNNGNNTSRYSNYSNSENITSNNSDYNYSPTPSTHYHTYSPATCTEPRKCSCGATNGSPLGHNYSKGKCTRCGASDPSFIMPTISLPSLPKTYSYHGYNKIETSCTINSITYKLDNYYDNGMWFTFTFNGTSTYNYQGNGQSSSMKVGYKLYDSNNVVIKSGTMYSQSVAVGESFSEDVAIYYLKPGGSYRLELLDVN